MVRIKICYFSIFQLLKDMGDIGVRTTTDPNFLGHSSVGSMGRFVYLNGKGT